MIAPPAVYNPIPSGLQKISGSVLKVVAVVTMLIDHIGAGIVYPLLYNGFSVFSLSYNRSILFYRILRIIGRTAFPIFCFLLVEGFFHTKSRTRYGLSLFFFALLSEIPFDLALIPGNEFSHTLAVADALSSNRAVYFKDQNVYWTLLIGFLVIWLVDTAFAKALALSERTPAIRTAAYLGASLASFLFVLAGYFGADLLYTDYDHKGVTLIVVLYLLARIRPLQVLAGYTYISLFGTNEIWSLPGFLLMLFYNGKRGFIRGRFKYAFYAFYPVHLFLIYVVRSFLL